MTATLSMQRIEFHSHTIYSKDSLTTPQSLLSTCRKKGVDRIVVTDHNSITGALLAKELSPEMVIVGEEIMTSKGEILAAYVKEEIPSGLPPIEVITRLRDQGSFISVSHPFDHIRTGSWELEDLEEITPYVDAIEVFNSRCMFSSFNRKAVEYAKRHGLPGTVGSDAHAKIEIGKATMLLPEFNDAVSLKQVLPQAKFETKLSSPFIHFYSRYAVYLKKVNKNLVPVQDRT